MTGNTEDAGTLAYLEDTARQGGLQTTLLDIEAVGWRDRGGFVDLDNRKIELAFKLYPWEWMFREAFGARLAKAATRWIEPPWKAILSNKGILPLLWDMFPGHPNLLPAYFEDDPKAAKLGASFVRKPLYSREGANVALITEGVTLAEQQGPYGAEGFIRQAFAPLPNFSGQYPVIGSWLIDHAPCGLSIREDENPVTGNASRFLPHAIYRRCPLTLDTTWKDLPVIIRPRRASLDGRLGLGFDGRLSGSDPSGPVGVQSSGFHLCLTFQMTGAVPNGFHAS